MAELITKQNPYPRKDANLNAPGGFCLLAASPAWSESHQLAYWSERQSIV